MRTLLLSAAATLALGASACTHPADSAGAPGFGDAVSMMHAAQTIPAEPTTEAPEGSGAQGALAQTRYKTGTTLPLLPASSSTMNPSN